MPSRSRPLIEMTAYHPFVAAFAFIAIAIASAAVAAAAAPATQPTKDKPVSQDNAYVRVVDRAGTLSDPVVVPKLALTDQQWHERLTPEQFKIMRSAGTEAAFCGGLLKNHEAGMYL